ncbi:MAG TPA: divalent-cation tolerance protein CutA [Vicinamibacteria bacterium]|nr:divalent-cation tolerance protein CutA [Vicinamibacteria bacterium]
MSGYLTVLTTLESEQAALRLARELVTRGLVACVNVVPGVRSVFLWKGELEEATEHLLLMKTRADRYDALAAAIDEIHPYDVPELIALSVERGAAGYFAWVDDCLDRSR